jgi:hypothetical protein
MLGQKVTSKLCSGGDGFESGPWHRGYLDQGFPPLLRILSDKSRDDASNYATTLASISLPSHDSLIILSFNAVQSDFLEASLNKPKNKKLLKLYLLKSCSSV